MNRVSGWHRRQTQVILLAIGRLVNVSANASNVHVVRNLWQDDAPRYAVAQWAVVAASPPRPYRSGRPGGASERGTERAKVQGALIHRGSHPHGFGLMATGIAGSSESPLPRLCPTIVSESASRHAAKPAQRCGDLRD